MLENKEIKSNLLLIDTSDPIETERKIQSFAKFGNGWSYGEGVSFVTSQIEIALRFAREAARNGLVLTDAFPGLNGEIMVTVYFRDYYLEFVFETDGSVTFCMEQGETELAYQAGLQFNQALNCLCEFKEKAWKQYVSSTPNITMIAPNADSPASRSETRGIRQESRSLTENAYSRVGIVLVNTSESTIRPFPKNPLFSGYSQQQYCHLTTG